MLVDFRQRMSRQKDSGGYLARSLQTLTDLACEQVHLFGRGASTKSWREEWGEVK